MTKLSIPGWLESVGFGDYSASFLEQGIDEQLLASLTDEDLQVLGVRLLGHRKRILGLIAARGVEGAKHESSGTNSLLELSRGTSNEAGQRRQLTVMFCDLEGSTALARRVDAEDFREITLRFHNAVRIEAEAFSGHVARFLGDAVLVYFGYPAAHEDDAVRAVSAGIRILKTVRSSTPLGHRLNSRIGIATGVVVLDEVGTGTAAHEIAASGETPNLAARLEVCAEPGQILVSEETRGLLGSTFEVSKVGPFEAKGIEGPLFAYRIDGEALSPSRFDAEHGASLIRLVGRTAELALLLDRWDLASSGESQTVLLTGQAGIGKSRLCRALVDRLAAGPPYHAVLLQGSPYFATSPLHPALRFVRRESGIVDEDSPAVRRDKLLRYCPLLGEEAVADLVDALGIVHDGPADGRPRQDKRRTTNAFITFFTALSQDRPLLLHVEDAHWIDPSTDELLGTVMSQLKTSRILLLITARPEYAATWSEPLQLTRLSLNKLARSQSAELISVVAGGLALPCGVIDEIVTKTDGMPLFVEELTKTVVHGLVEKSSEDRRAGRWVDPVVPATLHDSLMARLDQLGPAKAVAQVAAAVGREFSHRLMAAILSKDRQALLDGLRRLRESELIFASGDGEDALYTFKHALIRDVAYHSMLRRERLERHKEIAEAILAVRPRFEAEQPEILAFHREHAGQLEEARSYWIRAGDLAIRRSANAESASHFRSALRLLKQAANDEQPDLDLEFDLQMKLGNSLVLMEGHASAEAEACFSEARRLASDTGRVDRHIISFGYPLFAAGRYENVVNLLLDLRQPSLSLAPTAEVARSAVMGAAYTHLGRWEAAWASLTEARRLLPTVSLTEERPIAGTPPQITILMYSARVRMAQGYLSQARGFVAEALDFAEARADSAATVWALQTMASMDIILGNPGDALARARRAQAMAEKAEMKMRISVGEFTLGRCLLALGQPDEGRRLLYRGYLGFRATGGAVQGSEWACFAVEALRAAGLASDAQEFLDMGNKVQSETEERHYAAELHRLRGCLFQDAEDHHRAIEEYESAVLIAREQMARLFLMRALRDLATVPSDAGTMELRRRDLRDVLVEFTEGAQYPDLVLAGRVACG